MSPTARSSCPPEVLRCLPFYAEGVLSEPERGRVDAHAAACPACRDELEMIAGRAQPIAADIPDGEAIYARILGLIEAQEVDRSETPEATPSARRAWLVPVAAAAMVLLALGAGLWLGTAGLGPASTEPLYKTAAEPGQPFHIELDVLFRTEATAERINSSLRAIGGEIVAGPTRLGVYRVRLDRDSDAVAAAELLQAEGAGVATFAEPSHP
jgi:hypothetical protein